MQHVQEVFWKEVTFLGEAVNFNHRQKHTIHIEIICCCLQSELITFVDTGDKWSKAKFKCEIFLSAQMSLSKTRKKEIFVDVEPWIHFCMNMQKSHLAWWLLNPESKDIYNKPIIGTWSKKNLEMKIFFLRLTLTWEVKRGP